MTVNVGPADPRVRVWNDRPVRSGEHVVYEALRPDYPFASDRHHAFVLECARDAAPRYGERGIAHGFFIRMFWGKPLKRFRLEDYVASTAAPLFG